MKSLLIILSMVFMFSMKAQTFVPQISSGFDVTTGTATGNLLTLENKGYPIFTTKNGSKYIIGVSSKGKDYPIWIGTQLDMTYQDNGREYPVRQSASGSYFILVKSVKSNSIYAKYLELQN